MFGRIIIPGINKIGGSEEEEEVIFLNCSILTLTGGSHVGIALSLLLLVKKNKRRKNKKRMND